MTVQEYVKKNNMTMKDLSKIVGCSSATIYQLAKGGRRITNKAFAAKLTELGIDFEVYDLSRDRSKKRLTDFIYQEDLHIRESPIGEIYCYSLERVNELTKYLNEKKIFYHVRSKDGYWIVKYDRTLKEEEWIV